MAINLDLHRVLLIILVTTASVGIILSPMVCLASPVPIQDKQKSELDSNSWQDFLWEQQGNRRKKDVDVTDGNGDDDAKTQTNEVTNVTDSNGGGGSGGEATTTNNSTSIDGFNSEPEKKEEPKLHYFCRPDVEPCPVLKHYEMYPIEPEEDFFPCWTYNAFYAPWEWHAVPMKYFEEPPLKTLDEAENIDIRKHGSVMHLCTEQITDDVEKCKTKMENECINSVPSPIDIRSEEAVEDPHLTDMGFINYNVYFGFEMFFETDGTQLLFIKFLPHGKDDKMPGIRKGPLGPDNKLFLDRIIVRLGYDEENGSEHSLDGEYFGMELQFYFTADDLPYWQVLSQYKIMSENDGSIGHRMHVVSLFVKVAEFDKEPPDGSPFVGNSMETLSLAAEMFWQSVNENRSTTVRMEKKILSLEDFFSEPTQGIYYTYQGSLSHPPCLTHVGWTVFEKPIWIKHQQWRRFLYVHAEYSEYRFLAGNIRPQRHIQINPGIDMYIQMKLVEGQGPLRQSELDEAAENARQTKKSEQTGNETTSASEVVDLYLIRNYEDYKKYFAMQVRKSKNTIQSGGRHLNEFDYYDGENGRNMHGKSNSITIHTNLELFTCHVSVFRAIIGVGFIFVLQTII